MFPELFYPIMIGSKMSRNRMSYEPMGNHFSELDGRVSARDVAFYGERARGGCGIIFTETCSVNSKNGRANTRNICLDRDEIIPTLRLLVDEIHKYGSLIFVEIFHPGRQGTAAINGGVMLAPSAIMSPCTQQPVKEMTKEDIRNTVNDFIDAAERVQKAGGDGVEVHAAHGYLINEFLSPFSNHRTDEYGGSLENRARFACDIIDGIKARCGEGFEVLVRLTVDEMMETIGIDDGIHLDEGVEFAKIFEAHGVAAIDVTCGNYETMNVSWEPVSYDQGWKDHLGKAVKATVKIPVIAVSVMREPEYAVKMINSGVCDIAGSARQFFCDPDWGNKALRGRACEIRKCISCLNCMETLIASNDTDQPSTCSLNIEAGEEFNLNIDALEKGWGRKLAVIGAGPAGMECARVLALRGFGVTLFEKSDSLGGQIKLACKPPKKDRLHWIIDYFKPTLERLNVEIRLNTAPTAAELVAEGFENVFYAAGSSPVMPGSIPGIHGKNILTPPQILSGEVKLSGENICVIGSGMTGIETAELLAMNGNKITLWEMADDIGPGLFFQNLSDVLTRLVPTGCEMHPGNQLIKLEENEAFFKNVKTGEETSCKFDHAIVSLGVRPVPCPDELKAAFPKLVAIGDAEKGGRIRHATETGYFAAYNY